jgi:four helix bundle protein
MTYQRFEDLPVWSEAICLAEAVYSLNSGERVGGYSSLRDQLERAALSVSNNIAEGFERGSTADLLKFIYIARGSAGEVRSMLHLIEKVRPFECNPVSLKRIKALAESCSKQLKGWADSLQDSKIEGQRYLDSRKRREIEQEARAKAAMKKLRDRLPPNHPLRRQDAEGQE